MRLSVPSSARASRSTATTSSASATAGAARWTPTSSRSTSRRCAACCPAAAPSSVRAGQTRTRWTAALDRIRATVEALEIDALIAIGGEDTLGVANKLQNDGVVRVVGVPKTIDNDLGATDYTFGFDTAVSIATEAIDRLHTTAESHHRTLICEVMGRHAGWIALHSGLAGGANVILIPERPFDIDEVADYVKHRFATHRYAPIVVVSEGAVPKEGTLTVLGGREGRVRSRAARRHRPAARA